MNRKPEFHFLDFFAGIGGFRTGLEKVGGNCAGFAEIDKYARQSYKAMHDTEGELEWHDITAVTDDDFRRLRGNIDIIAGGFPCQAFSIAGNRMGFAESRGTLFFHIARAAKEIEPRYLFLENVKGLVNHDQGRTFGVIIGTLQELGYGHIEWGVFNSKFWGVPQNRERIFIVAELADKPQRPYLLDLLKQQEENGVQKRLRDILEKKVDEKHYLSKDKTEKLVAQIDSNIIDSDNPIMLGKIEVNGHDYLKRVYSVDGVSNTLTTMQGGGQEPKIAEPVEIRAVLTPDRAEKRQQGRRFKEDDEPAFTLNTIDRHGVAIGRFPKYRIRKLTPLECWRLQGYTDEQHQSAVDAGISDSQRYKQAGNSVTVNVIKAIGESIASRLKETK